MLWSKPFTFPFSDLDFKLYESRLHVRGQEVGAGWHVENFEYLDDGLVSSSSFFLD